MKKIVFTLQVFALIAMFPLYFVLELNHGTLKLSSGNITPADNQMQVKTISKVTSDTTIEIGDKYLVTGFLKSIY